jgi:hypothetical protein
MLRKIQFVLSGAHLLLILVILSFLWGQKSHEAMFIWVIPLLIDIPISFGLLTISDMNFWDTLIPISNSGEDYRAYKDVSGFWVTGFLFMIFGTLWWYYLPWVFSRFYLGLRTQIRLLKSNNSPN